ncbi:MAG: hypothetical protein LCH46_02140 [Proteobacteria bacterium]|nr:hypothetical protein [Pseudomonadota bacterium]
MQKSLDRKLKRITGGKYTPKDFIIADAKDPEMSGGVPSTGPRDPARPDGPFETVENFRQSIVEMTRKGGLDIMLSAASSLEAVADRGTFKNSPVTPAIRANDTTDIWRARGSSYSTEPSLPFRTANLAHCRRFADLGLYSVTFNNILKLDHAALEAYNRFREDAAKHRFRHFLEVFNPNAPQGLSAEQIPAFVNDSILRAVAGMTKKDRPLFLKIPFNGRKAMEELAGYDASLVVGILGGSGGTNRDTLELLHQGEKSGARVALFGRKIKLAESPLDLVAHFRPVIEGDLTPEEAVKSYHAVLAKKGLRPIRPLADDQAITDKTLEGFRG